MFRTLIYPSSGACDYSVELPHWSYCSVKTEDLAPLHTTIFANYHIGRIVLGSMCVGVSVWLGWSGIRVAGFTRNQPHRNSNTHRTKNNTTNVVIQQNSRKLLVMDILMSETCWAHKKRNKIASDLKLVFYSSASRSVFCLTTCSELLDLCAPKTFNDRNYIVVVILTFSSSLVFYLINLCCCFIFELIVPECFVSFLIVLWRILSG